MDNQIKEMLKEYLPEFAESELTKSKGGFYACPVCPSGHSASGDGACRITDDGKHWHCFSCGAGGDIFDLIGVTRGIKEPGEQFKAIADYFNIPIESGYKKAAAAMPTKTVERVVVDEEKPKTDYTEFFKTANSNLYRTEYLTNRGISKKVQQCFNIGFVEDWQVNQNAPKGPRIIIPTSKYSFVARSTEPNINKKVKAIKRGKVPVFNKEVLLNSDKPIYVLEGEIDALSVIEAGGQAVATGSTSCAKSKSEKSLIELVKKNKPKKPLILAFDNDIAGNDATEVLGNMLAEARVPYITFNVAGEYNDANDALVADATAFKRKVAQGERLASVGMTEKDATKYLEKRTSEYVDDFYNGIKESADTPYTPTGFPNLDAALDGGLFEGLYFIGAISSLGKTTLAMQIADQIAQSGQDVLIFSLEMARNEIIAKSVSRLTAELAMLKDIPTRYAKSNRGITTYSRYEHYSDIEHKLIDGAVEAYKAYSDHIYISEGIGDIGAKEIRQEVRKHIAVTGNVPVIVVDYLQILAPYSERMSDKQNTDKAVVELKRISRDYKTPVIGISSFNRNSYKMAVGMESFKESGRYTCRAI